MTNVMSKDNNNILNQVDYIDEDLKYKIVRVKKVNEDIVLYSKKSVEDLQDSLIVGYVNHNHFEDTIDLDKTYLDLGDEYLQVFKQKKTFRKLSGYVRIDDDKFVGYIKRRLLLPLIPLLFILLLFVIVWFIFFYRLPKGTPVPNLKELANTVISDGQVNNNDLFVGNTEYIEFAGYSFLYATENEPSVLLENPESNDVYFTYEVILEETGEVILEETGLIQPGTALPWEVFTCLEKGEHKVSFRVRTYDMTNTNVEYTPTIMDNITIKIY